MSSDSDDDDVPLCSLAKRSRTTEEPITEERQTEPSTSSSAPIISRPSAVPFVDPTVPNNEKYIWRNRHNPRDQLEWQENQGPRYPQTPVYYFDCMFGDGVIDLLVTYTNIYATQKNKVGNVTSSEMKCFLGILLYSGYIVVPRRYMYWDKSSDTDFSIVYNAMSRDRFTFIMTHLHCCDNTQIATESDKFAKMRPLFNMLNEIFLNMAPLEEVYSIDEAMVPYYGGHSCKQFIRGKPIRWGYKFWVGATRLGYVLWFDPYQGHAAIIPSVYRQLGLGAGVVLRFADYLQFRHPDAPFHLFFDNFFSSVPLFHELTKRGLKATGTIREDRTKKCPLPSNKEFKKTERGTFKYKSSQPGHILVCKWNDNSVVTVASNSETIEPLHKAKRFSQQQKKYILIDQPAIIKSYNQNMGGVDRSDQNIGLYRTSVRGKKWYFSLFSHCLDMAIHNAWQLYKSNGGEYDHLLFRRTVARGILETHKKSEKRGPCPTPRTYRETSRYDKIDHLIEYNDSQLRCWLCKKNTNFTCQKCKIYLHPKSCFVTYHTPT
ncbi:piggyBac transposable element-derived protein 3-like [Rhagoletis pomonella]|uniref:piggyBac transposable element-derived protein 3-like n=1 Tax=Rhagoletis pomonella TaxID=28610 RepID=UPI00177BF1CD|nr:piggyBac transposable element-derived protein 3-like [Rhagoletis pomonella]